MTDRSNGSSSRLTSDSAERLDRLFRLHSSRVLAYATAFSKRPADAEDIASETWVLAARYLSGLRADDDHAMKWLGSVVRTAARNYYRPRRASEQPRDWTDAVASRPLPSVAPAEAASDTLTLADLTARQATVMKLAAQGLTQRAIADRMGRRLSTVQGHLHRGARKLRLAVAA